MCQDGHICLNEEVVGFGTFFRAGGQGLVHSIAVRSDFQGRGYGKEILRRLELNAKVIGVTKFYCLARNSVGFFKKNNFISPVATEIHPKIAAHRTFLRDKAIGILLFKAPRADYTSV